MDLLILISLPPGERNIFSSHEGTRKCPKKSLQFVRNSSLTSSTTSRSQSVCTFFWWLEFDIFISLAKKIKSVSLFNDYDHFQDVVTVLNNPRTTHEITGAGEKFLLALCGAPITERDLNHHKFISFTKNVRHSRHVLLLSGLPPTCTAARQHNYRGYYQMQT